MDYTYAFENRKECLEKYEWDNVWWDSADSEGIPRVLYIGDSISCMTRRVATAEAENTLLFDGVGTSKAVDNPYFPMTVHNFALQEADRCAVLFNNGLHGGCNDTLIPLETYKQGVREIVSVLRRNQPQAKLVIVTSTYMSPKGDESFVIDEKMNAFVLERNAFLREFAAENGFAVNDLYALTAGNAAFRQTDGVHFEKESTDKLAAHVADFIDQQL